MAVLGIDCTTKWTDIGISQDGIVLGEMNLELGRAQSARLPIMVAGLLCETCMTLSDIDLIAAANGPGYYTGIRTGVAYAAALAESLSINVVPVSTMELFVYDLRYKGVPLIPVLKARKNSVYCAIYLSDGKDLTTEIPPRFCTAAECASLVTNYPDGLVVGSDRELYQELISLPNKNIPRPSGLGGQVPLMGERYRRYSVAPEKLRGEYLREPDIGPTFFN
ncbi:MAG: tRNA (adenosine(37)-N6)-threonylcarbamoyltransferase complex dimerization subunit type 1 TsaB [Synergistaceae bacterium]|nr:tRNA (adenosine(37)-N6)-threonylcarbamoyltransferase complex dimerization subunit type 1 TsaB [Synergistaceae bacterium]